MAPGKCASSSKRPALRTCPRHFPAACRETGPSLWATISGALSRAERRFNRPTGLEPGQPVYLVVEQVDFRGEVTLNDQCLGPVGLDHPLRHEIANLLIDPNRLSIEVEIPLNCQRPGRESRGGGLLGEVRLEIVD